MLEITHADGLGRITNWRSELKSATGSELTTPELLFVRTLRIPVPDEANAVLSADPSESEFPLIYHRGSMFAPAPALAPVAGPAVPVKAPVVAELPVTIPTHPGLKALTISTTVEKDHSKVLQDHDSRLSNARIVYESTTAEELDSIRSDPAVELVVLGSALELFDSPRRFVEYVMRVKRSVGQNCLIHAPALGLPSQLALLGYMGIDLFDTLPLINSARNHTLLTNSGAHDARESPQSWYCPCRFCAGWSGDDARAEPEFPYVLGHNYLSALQELSTVRSAIGAGTLRELVETRVYADLRSVNMLRFMDNLHYAFVEEYIPAARKSTMIVASMDSLSRPEVKRFRARVRERYVKPGFGRVLLLLPCSARKPYSLSRSHRAFGDAIARCGNPNVVHEVILTSPLGLVPRELELAYPAQHYDIPVTGIWYAEEIAAVRTQLKWLMENFEYSGMVSHLGDELEFLTEGFGDIRRTGGADPISARSLGELTAVLRECTSDCPKVPGRERILQMVTSLAMFQFGFDTGSKLTDGAQIKGRYPHLRIFADSTQLGMIEDSTGLISLTLDGGMRVLAAGVYCIEIDEFELKGDVFAPAVRTADTAIRPGDEVVVYSTKNGERQLKAVGRSVLTGRELGTTKRGKAVKVRHFSKHR